MIRTALRGMTLLTAPLLTSNALAEEKKDDVTLLFVQTSSGAALVGDTLTLADAGKTTLFFSDRPERIAGHMDSRTFTDSWGEGKDSFASDPPNATLSVFSGDDISNLVVELSEPKWVGADLAYKVKLIDGKMPATSGPSSLFIDIIGMPLTPLSYAGVARRTRRRAIVYGAPAMVAYAPPPTVIVNQPAPAAQPANEDSVQQMQQLQQMYDEGLINQAEYNQKKQAILNDM